MLNLSQLGNDLHSGKKVFDIIGKRRIWYSIAALLVVFSILIPVVRGGLNFGIEFRGGSEFLISNIQDNADESAAVGAVSGEVNEVPRSSKVGEHSVRVQTSQLSDSDISTVRSALATAYSVPESDVTSSFIGPTWGADVTRQMITGLVVFVLLAALVMALYFRTWKMAAAAMVALLHDLIVTAGIYAATGFEITPAAIIGFLTILGYSLYDTVVVFDKVRENTRGITKNTTSTFVEEVNRAVNQTLIRSINTSVVAVLPVAAILFIGGSVLGPGTLQDISLALFVGILVGAFSTIFLASPLYAQFRENEPELVKQEKRVLEARAQLQETEGGNLAESANTQEPLLAGNSGSSRTEDNDSRADV